MAVGRGWGEGDMRTSVDNGHRVSVGDNEALCPGGRGVMAGRRCGSALCRYRRHLKMAR